MKAIVVDKWQSSNDLKVQTISKDANKKEDKHLLQKLIYDKCNSTSVIVNVKAAGCNFFDILLVAGKYQIKPPFPFVPGSEFAGIISQVGKDVKKWKVGDKVFGFASTGAFAEEIVVNEMLLYPIPSSMSFIEAAGFSMTYATSYAGLVYRANLKQNEYLLVHAAAGGVGIAAVQIGKALGAIVIGTAGTDEKCNIVLQNGADYAINYNKENFVDKVKEITKGKGADVIYDPVGGDVFAQSTKCIGWNGRLIVVGFASGKIPSVRVNRVLLKNISIVGLHWGAYLVYEKERVEECYNALFQLYNANKIKPVVCSVFPLQQLPDALRLIASRQSYGKVIVSVADDNNNIAAKL